MSDPTATRTVACPRCGTDISALAAERAARPDGGPFTYAGDAPTEAEALRAVVASQDAELAILRAARPDGLREAAVKVMSHAEWNEDDARWLVGATEMDDLERATRSAPRDPAPALDRRTASRLHQPCQSDQRCCKNDGHDGEHLYPNPAPALDAREALLRYVAVDGSYGMYDAAALHRAREAVARLVSPSEIVREQDRVLDELRGGAA